MPVKGWRQIILYCISYSKYFFLNLYFSYYITTRKFKQLGPNIPNLDGPPAPPWVSKRVGWFVYQSSRSIPGASCLSRALTARFALSRLGHAASLHIGVAKETNDFSAHAWLTSGGKIIVGDESGELDRYTEMTDVQGKKP
jgi:hypothetical protein